MIKPILAFILLSSCTLLFATEAEKCNGEVKDATLSQAVKWYRVSAEKVALYRQVYNIADKYVALEVKSQKLKPKSWGIVLDIDETTLDNSWYFKNCGEVANSPDIWSEAIDLKEKSTALPGVKNFTCKIKSMGGYVSFVTNRDGSYKKNDKNSMSSTINNLKKEGICFDQLIEANNKKNPNPYDKNARFEALQSGKYNPDLMVWSNILPAHKVIAYIGDNIQDFPKFKQADMDKLNPEDSTFNIFGNGYFILPNPIYGSWQNNTLK